MTKSALFCPLSCFLILCCLWSGRAEAYRESFQTFYQYYGDSDKNIERSVSTTFVTYYGKNENSFLVSYSLSSFSEVSTNPFAPYDWNFNKFRNRSLSIATTFYLARLSSLTAGITRLESNFFDGDIYSLTFAQGFFENNTNLSIGYSYFTKDFDLGAGILSQVPPYNFLFSRGFRTSTARGLTLTWSQVLTKTTIMRLSGTYAMDSSLNDPWDGKAWKWDGKREAGEQPNAFEILADFRQYFPTKTSLQLTGRYYENEADIRAQSYDVKVFQYLTPSTIASVRFRYIEEADYSPQAVEYLEQVLSRQITRSEGLDARMVGVRMSQDILEWMPSSWNLNQKLRSLNLVGKFDFYHRHQTFLNFPSHWSRNDQPRLSRVFLFGLEFHFL